MWIKELTDPMPHFWTALYIYGGGRGCGKRQLCSIRQTVLPFFDLTYYYLSYDSPTIGRSVFHLKQPDFCADAKPLGST
jgi:hypothetical protein